MPWLTHRRKAMSAHTMNRRNGAPNRAASMNWRRPREWPGDVVNAHSHRLCAPLLDAIEVPGKSRSSITERPMSLKIRRVVTGHDDDGKAVVLIDEICRNVISRRERHHSCVVWSTASFPVDNSGSEDESVPPVGAPGPDGSVFRIIEYGPGVAPRNHRTSTIDYAVVISGEIDLELDDTPSICRRAT